MIIPVRCFTCGKILGNEYDYFIEKVIERKKKEKKENEKLSVINLNNQSKLEKTIEGKVLDEIGCIRMCCRSKMLTHIPLIDEI